MEELFVMIGSRLRGGMPELALVAEDCGGLKPDGGNYAVPFPCALIDIGKLEWSPCANDLRGRAEVVVKLAVDCAPGSAYAGEDAETFASRQQLVRRLHTLLHGWQSGADFSSLQLLADRFYTLDGQKKVYEATFVVRTGQRLFAGAAQQ